MSDRSEQRPFPPGWWILPGMVVGTLAWWEIGRVVRRLMH